MSADSSESVPIRDLPSSDRVLQLQDEFAARFGKTPDFFVRVPGRVNLIGEHIDYCGYGVCPMALEQDILLAVSVESDKTLRLHNVDRNYPDFQIDLVKDITITVGTGSPDWHQYFLCGVKGIFDSLAADFGLRGLKVAVTGNVPHSAGLSSSSALVSAAALAVSHAYKLPLSKTKIADLCAVCERHIGTQGGGMDQAIAFLATEGCAKFIEFSPLRSVDVLLPRGAVFVIAHSMAELNKAATADFNCRVVECRLAAQIMAKRQGLEWTGVRKLGELQKALAVDLSAMISIAERTLHQEPYTKEEIVRELRTTSDDLDRTSLTQNTRHVQSFKLRQRALHVFKEAHRVERFTAACAPSNGAKGDDGGKSLEILGQLMSESHESLRDLYECSHPELDRLVDLSGDLAFGARLTGAGWGGCVVALVPPENVGKYVKTLKAQFYKGKDDAEINSLLFATSPKAGACIYIKRE